MARLAHDVALLDAGAGGGGGQPGANGRSAVASAGLNLRDRIA
jgi:hypothetical protein